MATATKKAAKTAKTETKSINKKTSAKKTGIVKPATAKNGAKTAAKVIEKTPMTVGDGNLDHPTAQKTAKSVTPAPPAKAKKTNSFHLRLKP